MKNNVKQILEKLVKANQTFAVYRLPKDNSFHLVFDNSNDSKNLQNVGFTGNKGFVFKPFIENENYSSLFIKTDTQYNFHDFNEEFDINTDNLKIRTSNKFEPQKSTPKIEYISNVNNTIESINNGLINKAIISGIVVKEVENDFNIIDVFQKLSAAYKDVFVYIVNSPETGCWLGATPELLLKFNDYLLETVSLAGTKSINNKAEMQPWQQKEIKEQQIVTDHIIQCFENVYPNIPLKISETKTISTGYLLHLQTDFRMEDSNSHFINSISTFLNELHPTPAILGNPKKQAVDHILHIEKHPRGYYTGYLGPVGYHESSELFVNLRCLNYVGNQLNIYVGAGITENSVAEDEWNEIQLKAQTILSVLP